MTLNRGVKRAYVLQNRGTGSFVTHTESSFGIEPVCLIWDDQRAARDHANDLELEYRIGRPALPLRMRSWKVVPATRDQIIKALAVGAYGPEYTQAIHDHTSQFKSRQPDAEAEAFRQEIEQNPLAPRYRGGK